MCNHTKVLNVKICIGRNRIISPKLMDEALGEVCACEDCFRYAGNNPALLGALGEWAVARRRLNHIDDEQPPNLSPRGRRMLAAGVMTLRPAARCLFPVRTIIFF